MLVELCGLQPLAHQFRESPRCNDACTCVFFHQDGRYVLALCMAEFFLLKSGYLQR